MLSNYARLLALAGWLGLMIGLPLWLGWVGTIVALPLLLPIAGLCRARRYTYAWTSLLVLAYLACLITEFIATRQPLAVAPALFGAMALFTGCLLFVRLRSRELNEGGR